MTALLLSYLCILVLLSAFFSATETALFSLSSAQTKGFSQSSDPSKQLVAQMLSHPSELLVTLLMLNTIANILIQNVIAAMFGKGAHWIGNVGIPLGITLIFGEVVPKSLGLLNNARFAPWAAPALRSCAILFYPFRKIFSSLAPIVSRWQFFFLRKEQEISIEELKHVLKTSREGGVLDAEEADIIRGYLNLENATVKELMRPREEILYYDVERPISALVHLFVDEECSRIPVCKKEIDGVMGIISARAFFMYRNTIHTAEDLMAYVKKPFFVPESLAAPIVLRQFYERQEEMAMIVDEYGSVRGLCALEDLIEVVIGEIADKRDERYLYTRSSQDVVIASGKLELAHLEDLFGVSLPSPNNMVTVGGWLTERFGDIPKTGEKLTYENLFFHVIAADPTRVRRIYIRRLS